MAKALIYIDNQNGLDSNTGDILSPVETLLEGYNRVGEGGTLVLQTGDGSTYGNLSISKNINIQAAYGASPLVGSLTVTEAQGSFQGITFSSGISVTNTKGAIKVTECSFESVDVGILLNGVKYVTIAKNTFSGYNVGVLINIAEEVNIASNLFYNNGFKAIEVITVGRIDLWRNTIHGAQDAGAPSLATDENLRIIYVTLTGSNISNKNVPLPGFSVANPNLDGSGYLGYDIAVNVIEGPTFQYGLDYVGDAFGSIVSWDGYLLENELVAGDVLRIMYSEDVDPGGGEAIRVLNVSDPNSTIDSNNIGTTVSNITLGVFFNTALKIRYNNFYGTTTHYSTIASPTNSTGNFSGDPLYVNAGAGDFRLENGSPDIDAGDPIRWDSIYSEILGSSRTNISPFDRDIDRDGIHRVPADHLRLGSSSYTGDVGAYEYLSGSHVGDYYVDEEGYDRAYFGGSGDPFGTVDRAFDPLLTDGDIYVGTNYVPITGVTGGSSYGRYRSKNTVLSVRSLRPGNQTKKDVVYITPTYPSYDTGGVYIDPDGSDVSGDGSSVSPFRTITRALQESGQNVIVSPGIYPQFTGEANKRLIGIPVTKTVALPWDSYCNVRKTDWNLSGTGDVEFSKSLINVEGDYSIDSYDYLPSPFTNPRIGLKKFTADNEFNLKFNISFMGGSFVGGMYTDTVLYSDSDSLFVGVEKSSNNAVVRFIFTINGSSYTFSNTITSYFSGDYDEDRSKNIRVEIYYKNDKLRATFKHAGSSKYKTISFVPAPTYSLNWASYFNIVGAGTLGLSEDNRTKVNNLRINADSFSSTVIEICTSSYTRRKIFAIRGEG